MILAGRELPKINGSSGGFIALIVCLGVLIVVLCAAVYILLRDHSPSDQERSVRRQLSRRRREQQQSDLSSPFTYTPSSTGPITLIQRIRGIFGLGATTDESSSKKSQKRNKGGQGWLQAESGDEWDGETEVQAQPLSRTEMQKDAGDIQLTDRSIAKDDDPVDLSFQPPQVPYSETNSTSSVLLYNPFISSSAPRPLRTAVSRLQTADALSPSSASLAPSSTMRALDGSPEPYTTGSLDDIQPLGERHFSMQSGGSVSTRTSHTGTKFIESLE